MTKMEVKEEEEGYGSLLKGITQLTNWFPKLVETQVDLIATTLTSLLTIFPAPSFSFSSNKPPLHAHQVVRKVGFGLLGAVYAAAVLTMVMVLAVVLGVVLVNYWVDQPVFVKEKLYFDYTDVNPQALFVLRGKGEKNNGKNVIEGVPVGHTLHVSVSLLVPDSDYNREIGVFQLMAEVETMNGRVLARSSQPSMLEFHSYPIRLVRTFMMGFPILLGFSRETQKIDVQMLRYKEDNILRTKAVKITLMPRANMPYLPQIYEAEIIMHSKLPRVKEFVYKWKWTFYVWTSLYVYVVLLMLLLCFFKTLLILPVIRVTDRPQGIEPNGVRMEETSEVRVREGKDFSEELRKWQQYRRKRKVALLSRSTFSSETIGSTSASSYTITKDDLGPTMEDVGDSESICKGG